MKSIIVLGPDRVGKSTLIENTKKSLVDGGYEVACLHFREVQPHHHSPVEQFDEIQGFDGANLGDTRAVDYLLIDRFVPDTLFYETYRSNFPQIDKSLARTVESRLIELSGKVSNIEVVHLAYQWSDEIASRHRAEILEKYPGCTEYWIDINLKRAQTEHEEYNRFVSEYFNLGGSLIPRENYLPVSLPPKGLAPTLFDDESLTGMRISL